MATDEKVFKMLMEKLGILEAAEVIKIEGIRETEYQFVAKSHPKVKGYSGFRATFTFDAQGDFTELDIWE